MLVHVDNTEKGMFILWRITCNGYNIMITNMQSTDF